jgi:hypothetical protein
LEDKTPAPRLSAREVYQVLRDVALGIRMMTRLTLKSWAEVHVGQIVVDVGGWVITLVNNCDCLDYCDACAAPDGRTGSFESWNRFGTDPTSFLSAWEREQLERLVAEL